MIVQYGFTDRRYTFGWLSVGEYVAKVTSEKEAVSARFMIAKWEYSWWGKFPPRSGLLGLRPAVSYATPSWVAPKKVGLQE